jgi:hypothetical protein
VTAARSKMRLSGHLGRSRSRYRLQHPLKRERPTGMEPKRLVQQCGWKDGDRGGDLANDKEIAEEAGGKPAISSFADYMNHDHPSRLTYGSLRSAWTGPGRDPNGSFLIRGNGRLCPGGLLRLPLVGTETSCRHVHMKFNS